MHSISCVFELDDGKVCVLGSCVRYSNCKLSQGHTMQRKSELILKNCPDWFWCKDTEKITERIQRCRRTKLPQCSIRFQQICVYFSIASSSLYLSDCVCPCYERIPIRINRIIMIIIMPIHTNKRTNTYCLNECGRCFKIHELYAPDTREYIHSSV